MEETHYVIQKTNDYSIFKDLKGNRILNPLHLKRLKASMEKKNLLFADPILVNDNYEIIDGQHRFQVAQELELPIYFIKIENLTIEDVQLLNTNTSNWGYDDFMNSYIDLGLEEYKKYKDFKEKYSLTHTVAILITMGGVMSHGNLDFKEGTLKFTNYEKSIDIAEKLKSLGEYYSNYSKRLFYRAFLAAYRNPLYDHTRMLNKLSYATAPKLVDCDNEKDYLLLLQEVYNYKLGKFEEEVFLYSKKALAKD